MSTYADEKHGLTYYEILDLDKKRGNGPLSAHSVKKAYKHALLMHHPDKTCKASSNRAATVDEVALAYKVLSDPVLRAEYDAILQNAGTEGAPNVRMYHTGLESIDLDDLIYNEESGKWQRECRCGSEGGYIITERELEQHIDDGELITGCKGCSLWLRVVFSVDD